jgi:hypothetical protein
VRRDELGGHSVTNPGQGGRGELVNLARSAPAWPAWYLVQTVTVIGALALSNVMSRLRRKGRTIGEHLAPLAPLKWSTPAASKFLDFRAKTAAAPLAPLRYDLYMHRASPAGAARKKRRSKRKRMYINEYVFPQRSPPPLGAPQMVSFTKKRGMGVQARLRKSLLTA